MAPAQEAARASFKTTTPIFKTEIRPFAREILPTINALAPDTKKPRRIVPQARHELLGAQRILQRARLQPRQEPGRLPVLPDWGRHNLNSVVSSADAHGPLGRALLYINCEVLPLLAPAAKINKTVNIPSG